MEVLRWILFDNHKFTSYFATHRFMKSLPPQAPDPAVMAFLKGRFDAAPASSRSTSPSRSSWSGTCRPSPTSRWPATCSSPPRSAATTGPRPIPTSALGPSASCPAGLEGPLRADAGRAHRAAAIVRGWARVGDFAEAGNSPRMVASVPSGVLISPVYPPGSNDLSGFSHLGGMPSLPEGMEWPRDANGAALHFLAQIDLSTLPASGIVDFQGKPLPEFPREGALYFFADCATYGSGNTPKPRTAFFTRRPAEAYARCNRLPIFSPTMRPKLVFSPPRIIHIFRA